MAGAVTLSDIWMFQISLSPCAEKLANSFGMIDTSRISWPRKPKPRAMFSNAGRPKIAWLSSMPSARNLWNSEPYPPSFITQISMRMP